ncbi:hypothetical protein Zm00014a_029058 [Zea mays]|uniref:Uncharacterized protein n=1 Tax=Zea mays TaxID=4577 RepID=A0A3L6F0D0_MAIZE|nr:hypothetical protein Zm00014a_029058 [Zea mays]
MGLVATGLGVVSLVASGLGATVLGTASMTLVAWATFPSSRTPHIGPPRLMRLRQLLLPIPMSQLPTPPWMQPSVMFAALTNVKAAVATTREQERVTTLA